MSSQSVELTDQVDHLPQASPDQAPGPLPEVHVPDPEPVAQADDPPPVPLVAEMPHRALGSPLQMGASRRPPLRPVDAGNRLVTPTPPNRTLGGPAPAAPTEEPSSLQRAIAAVRSALPIVQRILPLLDGNLAAAITNMLTGAAHAAAPPAPKIDLTPLEDRVSELRIQHRGLRDQIMEQSTALMEQTNVIKRVEDQLEMVREATDRNTLEQQEMLEDLKAFGSKVKVIAILTLILVGAGVALNVLLFLRIKSVFP